MHIIKRQGYSLAERVSKYIANSRSEKIKEIFAEPFLNDAHRLQEIATVEKKVFINDSRSTNINSTWYALQTIQRPIVLLIGGVSKGEHNGILEDLILDKVRHLILIGKNNNHLLRKFKSHFNHKNRSIIEIQSMNSIVQHAYNIAVRHDVVLLSPGFASFDLYKNYEDRGNQFIKAVQAL